MGTALFFTSLCVVVFVDVICICGASTASVDSAVPYEGVDVRQAHWCWVVSISFGFRYVRSQVPTDTELVD